MEFNILQHFKGLDELPKDPFKRVTKPAPHCSFTGEHGSEDLSEDGRLCKKAGISRRNFIKSSLGFSAGDARCQRRSRV